MTVTERLITLLDRPILPKDRERAALLLLDWTACAVAGKAELGHMKFAQPPGEGPCQLIGTTPSNAQFAAFHNGCLGNVLEMDDVDRQAILHPGPTVIPAALAMVEDYQGHNDKLSHALLMAIVIGYETTIRIGRAAGTGHYAYWHSTGTCGTFGAAAAASFLIEKEPEDALTIAGTLAAGLWQTRHDQKSHAKQIHTGHAAEMGVKAAILSSSGVRGPEDILEGKQGFFAAMCPGSDVQDVLKDYGNRWLIHDTSIKPYPACRHAHPAIDAALKAELADGPILVESYTDAINFCDNPNPGSVIEAKFSLQHSVAISLVKGVPTLADFHIFSKTGPNTSEHAHIQKVRQHIMVRESNEFTQAYPAHYGAAVTVGGTRYVAKDAYGDPENPMSERAVMNKAMMLLTYGGLGENAIKTLCQTTLDLADGRNLDDYLDLWP